MPTLLFYFLIKYFPIEDLYFSLLPFGLAVTILLLYSLRFLTQFYKTTPSLRDSLYIGCAQALSLLPGISRMGSTYVIARWCGIEPTKAFRFSCIIQLPLIIAGFTKGFYEYINEHAVGCTQESLNCTSALLSELSSELLCMLVASIISYAALYSTWLLVKREKLWYYAYYLVIPFSISLLINILCS